MALLNENRNRVPLIPAVPVDGAADAIRGQMRMLETEGNTVLYVCTKSSDFAVAADFIMTAGTGEVTYTAKVPGLAGNNITVEHFDSANNLEPLAVSVTNTNIIVTLETDAGSSPISTAAEVAAAILASPEASALVTAVDTNAGVVAVEAATSLTGGLGPQAANLTIEPGVDLNDAITYRAREVGVAGNAITVAHIDPAALASLSVVVTGTDIVVNLAHNGAAVVSTADDVSKAVEAHIVAGKLVHAEIEGTALGLAAAATAASLAGGVTESVWTAK